MRIIFVLLILILSFTFLFGKDDYFTISTGMEGMTGYTLYKIGGKDTFPDGSYINIPYDLSQLKFPLNTFLFSTDININFLKLFQVQFNIKKSVTSSAGKMEDSDWASSNSLEIFSTSDSSLNQYSIEGILSISTFHFKRFSLAFGCGLLYEYYYYDISNLSQTYLYNSNTVNISGKVSTYELLQYIPYFAFSGGYASDKFTANFLLGFSPYTICSDRDNHILRSKLITADSYGTSVITRAAASYYFVRNFFIKLKANFLYTAASGTQTQVRYADNNEGSSGPLGTIGYKLETFQLSGSLEFGYRY